MLDAFPQQWMRHEEWRPVSGWPYEVSDEGRVRRLGGRILKPWCPPQDHRPNYMKVSLYRNGEPWNVNVHDLVRQAFCVAPEERRFRELLDNVSNVGV